MTVLVLGHRGASAHAVENTMAAFERARADGADGVELDVRLGRDGTLVVFHDDDLRRLAGRAERIADLDAGQLARVELAGGARIPRLEEVLEATSPLLVNVEIKPPGWRSAREVVRAVARCVERAAAMDRVLVSSFDAAVVALVRRTTPLRTGLLFHARQRRPLRRAWLAPILRPHALHPEKVLVDGAAMKGWRRAGYA
ncbi:MAG TPA: glycerophosphodiester phosphodiesterase family protein, partial [Kofleriaceae bacterium]|nr:glycerophosphodiester phosphodiesterase family protein [Kofleriaceae bacterium]